VVVASAGPYASLHFVQTDNRASTPLLLATILIIKSSLPKEVEEEDSGDPAGAGSLGKWSW